MDNNKTNIIILDKDIKFINKFYGRLKDEVPIVEKLFNKYLYEFNKKYLLKEDRYDANYEFLKKLQIIRADFFSEVFINYFLKKIIEYYCICKSINDIDYVCTYRENGELFFFKIEDEEDGIYNKCISELCKNIFYTDDEFLYYISEKNNYSYTWYTYVYPFDHGTIFFNDLYYNVKIMTIQLKSDKRYILVKKYYKYIINDKLINLDSDNIFQIEQELNYFYPGFFERIGIFHNDYFKMEVDNDDLLKTCSNIIDITKEEYIEKYNISYNKAKAMIRKGL